MLKNIQIYTFFLLLSKISSSTINITIKSLSICDAIEKFYAKHSRNVNIIDFNGSQGELAGKIVENLNNSMTVTIQKLQNSTNFTNQIEDQTILLFDNFKSLNDFNMADPINIKFINPIRLLVYCVNTSELEISRLKTDLVIPPYYYFIIIGSDTEISLWTFENRPNLLICHESQTLVKVNEFSSVNLTWINLEIFPKKYKNFHGCVMNIGMNDFDNFDRVFADYDGKEIVMTTGLSSSLLLILGDQLNFTLHSFQCKNPDCLDQIDPGRYLYNIILTISIDSYAVNTPESYNWRMVMLNIQCTPQLLIPPGDLYTSIEKMLLPFDTETWIGLFGIFVSGIIAISIISQFPAKIKDLVFGKNIGIPSLNFFLAFFGEAQKRSPDGTFARFVWIFFIFYCLVIRTCYQGKLFEFTTTAVRKPEHQTLNDLREQNFTLYMLDGKHSDKTIEFIDSVMGLNIRYVSEYEYSDIYLENITHPSFKGTVFSSDLENAFNAFYLNTPLTKRSIPTPFSKSYYGIGFMYPNLWTERFNEILSDLITGGIVNYHLQKITKSKWNLMPTIFEPENVVLNLHHLGFGFQICLIFAYLAFVVFLVENGYFWMKNLLPNGWFESLKWKKHKIIMVLSARTTNCKAIEILQDKPIIKSSEKVNEKLSAKVNIPKYIEDEYSSDDSSASNESILRRAFGRRVKLV